MEGWIKISRNIVNHWLWEDAEYLKRWMDLLLLAAWEPKKKLVQGQLVEIGRGQAIVSVRFLQDRWAKRDKKGKMVSKPSERTVINFLRLLEEDEMILRQNRQHQITMLTICNYEHYQANDNTNDNINDNTNDNTIKEIEEIKKEKIISKDIIEKKGTKTCFVAPKIDEVRAYIAQQNYTFDAESFYDFYQSKGWMVGKNKMKDWKAAVRNWQRMEKQRRTGSYGIKQEQYDRRRATEVTANSPEDYEGRFI